MYSDPDCEYISCQRVWCMGHAQGIRLRNAKKKNRRNLGTDARATGGGSCGNDSGKAACCLRMPAGRTTVPYSCLSALQRPLWRSAPESGHRHKESETGLAGSKYKSDPLLYPTKTSKSNVHITSITAMETTAMNTSKKKCPRGYFT